jgi:hypothetical protein
MRQAGPPVDTWRWASKITALWVAVLGTGVFALAVFMARSPFHPIIYVINFALLVLVVSMPIALGQWYGSWKVAWLTLASEGVYCVVALIILSGWYLFNFPSPR